jgi:hypothetical protein
MLETCKFLFFSFLFFFFFKKKTKYCQELLTHFLSYEEGLQDIMYCYSDSPWKTPLTEEEVFIGNIMGNNHKQTRHQKESSRTMREGKYFIASLGYGCSNSISIRRTSQLDHVVDHGQRNR